MSFRTYQAVLDHSKQPPTFKFLLTLIASSENEESGRCNPGIEVLAFYHTTLPRSIRKLLLPLVDAGELVIAGRTGHSNQYYIPLYPGEPGYYDPGPCQDTDIHKCNGQHGPILSRTEIAMQNSPRWKAQESRKKEARQSRRSTKRDVLQDRGSGGGVSSRTGGGVLQDRGGCPPGQGGGVLQDSQNLYGKGNEQEMNLGATPSQENRRADPEPEADPPPLRDAPPAAPMLYHQFREAYEREHGRGHTTQELHAAYSDYQYEFEKQREEAYT